MAPLPSLGLLYVAAVTPKDHDLQYFEVSDADQLPDELFDCDVVLISTLTAQAFDVNRFSKPGLDDEMANGSQTSSFLI